GSYLGPDIPHETAELQRLRGTVNAESVDHRPDDLSTLPQVTHKLGATRAVVVRHAGRGDVRRGDIVQRGREEPGQLVRAAAVAEVLGGQLGQAPGARAMLNHDDRGGGRGRGGGRDRRLGSGDRPARRRGASGGRDGRCLDAGGTRGSGCRRGGLGGGEGTVRGSLGGRGDGP